jgi:xanthine dehydrogenase molybdopterin-binding subunit B
VLAIDLDLYHNAGNSWDLSHSIMDRALVHSDSCYKIPHVRVKGNMCFTHMSSNTAFRGFGGPQVRLRGGRVSAFEGFGRSKGVRGCAPRNPCHVLPQMAGVRGGSGKVGRSGI